MENAFSRIIAIFTAMIMLFIVPMIINMQRQENLIQMSVMQDTVQFVDSVRNMGVLTKEMYERYENKIRRVQGGLEIYMVHTAESISIGSQEVERVETLKTENEIISLLESNGTYDLQMGDYFRVEIKKKAAGYERIIYGGAYPVDDNSTTVYAYYGGSVRYED